MNTDDRPLRGIIDASAFSGRPTGPMVVARQIVDAWPKHYPADDITAWMPASDNVGALERTRRHLGRPRASFTQHEPDFYLSLNPTLPPLVPSSAVTGVIIFDERHLAEPKRFTRAQRAYRRAMWTTGVQRADAVFTASDVSRDRLLSTMARSVTLIPLGSDHVSAIPRHSDRPVVVALCHRENKPVRTAIDVWRAARSLDPTIPDLVAIGVDETAHAQIRTTLTDDEQDHVTLEGRLPQPAFDSYMGSATALLFLSSNEGYGLPLAEGLQLGVPVVAFELPSLRQISGPNYPMASPGDITGAAQLLVDSCGPNPPISSAELATWADCVDAIRGRLCALRDERQLASTSKEALA